MGKLTARHDGGQIIPQDPTETSPLLGSEGPDSSKTLRTASSSAPFALDGSSEVLSDSPTSSSSTTVTTASPDDEESWLENTAPSEDAPVCLDRAVVLRIIVILLIAVFVVNADHSLVLATHPRIASEFNALEWSSWLFTSFGLAGAAMQAVFGKLSDIYGRKPIILISYAVFALGCTVVALARSMVAVILGRVLSGSVGSGMTVLVSILITDLVPIRESASWRSYVNVAATTGRSLGGPLGGWLTDAVGWRWSFGLQVPMLLVAIFLCSRNLPSNLSRRNLESLGNQETSTFTKLARIDFLGAAVLSSFILSSLLPLELGGDKVPWTHPLVPCLFGAAAIFLTLFVLVETRWAKEPILEPALFTQRDAVISFLIMGLQSAAQFGMIFSVPLYFQVVRRASNTEAGAHLFPAVAGNAVGGILGGCFIKKTGKYKWLVYLGTLSGGLCYVLLLTRWHGQTNWLEALYILPGGIGMGLAYSVLFVTIQAAVNPAYVAAAVSTLFLCNTMGSVIGVACASATMQEMLQRSLEAKLRSLGFDRATTLDIISKALSSVDYTFLAKGKVAQALVASYVEALLYAHGLSLCFVLLGFFFALFLRERNLEE